VEVNFFSEDVDYPLFDEEKVKIVISKILSLSQKELDNINYIFCSDSFLLDINIQYLQHDYYTDIITFDYSDDYILSDIYISTDRVLENAKDLEIPFINEFYRILIHGVLHLVGFDDKDSQSKNIMTQKEDEFLSYLI
jgi:probable rRNA maturation factor